MENVNSFRIQDNRGREFFKNMLIKLNDSKKVLIKESKDDYASWDISYKWDDINIIGEIKTRDGYYSYSFSDIHLELKKISKLVELKKQMDLKTGDKCKIHYITIFPKDQTIIIYDVTNIMEEQITEEVMWPESTFGYSNKYYPTKVYNCNKTNEIFRGTFPNNVF